LLGYTLPINFRQPYLAINLQDFWRRWHISLSTFIRDYVYIPLGGNRKGFTREQMNLLLAMVLSGLWHGASYTFILWGFLHGLGAVFLNLLHRWSKVQVPPLASRFFTLLFIGFAWIFFRSSNIDDAWILIGSALHFKLSIGWNVFSLLLFSTIFFALSSRASQLQTYFVGLIEVSGLAVLTISIVAIAFLLVLLGPSGVPNFIYYRF